MVEHIFPDGLERNSICILLLSALDAGKFIAIGCRTVTAECLHVAAVAIAFPSVPAHSAQGTIHLSDEGALVGESLEVGLQILRAGSKTAHGYLIIRFLFLVTAGCESYECCKNQYKISDSHVFYSL